MSSQLKLDLSRPINPFRFNSEKKTEMISFRAAEDFKKDLQAIALARDVDLAVLIHEYALNGYLEDYKNIMLLQMNGQKTIQELLGKG